MKKRTKAENAAYTRTLRARQKAQPVAPAAVAPVAPAKSSTPDVAPSAVSPCLSCAELRADLTQARAELSRLKVRIAVLEGTPPAVKVDLPHLPPIDRPPAPKQGGKALDKDEADALRLRVIADKVSRINSFGKGHNIGSVRA